METRRLLLLTGIALTLLCCTAGAEDRAEAPFKMASLVLSQGISFELGPATLTHVLDTVTNASKSVTASLKAPKDNSSIKKMFGEQCRKHPFVRVSDNVISEITRTMRVIPNTLVAVDFGDVKRLSPWRVRRKFTKSSGRQSERLTIRDALLALNETIAEYEGMLETTFVFEKGGSLVSVSGIPVLAMPRKGDVKLVLFTVVESDSQGDLEVHFPSSDFLKRPLADFSEVRIVIGSLVELVQAAVSEPERVAGLRAEIESVLPAVPEVDKFWEERLVQFEAEKMAATEKSQEEKAAQNAEKEFGENKGRRAGETKAITLPGGAALELVWCPSGSFTMGSPASEAGREDDEKQHPVKLTQGFWLGKYEVTQRQWESVMGSNPSKFKGPEMPVETISWEDCQAFIRAVQREIAYLKVRLPTEAEWEYACRSGKTGPYPGNGILNDIGWYEGNSGSRTHVVGTKMANEWGFFDMVGNVYEWCSDWYGEYSSGLEIDPVGSAAGTGRVICGGSWFSVARNCRSADRDRRRPSFRSILLGFRLCCSTGSPE